MNRPAIDLRSDTVTKPTAAMRRAMADAAVGDDVYGEDPTAARLEEKAAEVLGKEAALFVPTGTMANQIALLLHCRPGEAVVLGEGSHTMLYESGAGAAWAGVQFDIAGQGGPFDRQAFVSQIHPDELHYPPTRLVVVENTHNRSGGRVFPQDDVVAIAEEAHGRGMAVHIDGARIWNAAVATGREPAELARPADTVSACFSKGLGAPAGSVLAGPREAVLRARRLRKMLGGGMRQVGVLCAAALYALEHHREQLAQDHALARRLAEGLAQLPGVSVELSAVQTNIVMFHIAGRGADALAAQAKEAGVLVSPTSPTRLRAVTHRDVDAAAVDAAIAAFAELARPAAPSAR